MDNAPGPKTVLVVDDHPVVALGIELVLRSSRSLTLLGIVTDPTDPKGMIAASKPDVLVLDLAFSGTVNLALVRQARAVLPRAVIVVFSSLPPRLYRRDALDAGADAYLTKDHDLGDLVELIIGLSSRAAKAAAPAVQNDARPRARLPDDAIRDGASLTPKESAIARLISRGLSVAEIAARVGANPNTVAVHRDNIRRKLGCRNSSELVARLARIYAPGDSGA